MLQHTLFDTALGRVGIAWQVGEGAAQAGTLWAVQLPEPDDARTTARLLRGAPPGETIAVEPVQPDDPALPAHVQRAMASVVALMQGERDPLTHVALDMDRVPAFHRRVYEVAREIRPGQTRTYGELARELGDPAVARAVPHEYPWQRPEWFGADSATGPTDTDEREGHR